MPEIHHLGHSQSERIAWLCEELALDYALEQHTRDPFTMLSPPALQALHPLGAAPVLQDGDLLRAGSYRPFRGNEFGAADLADESGCRAGVLERRPFRPRRIEGRLPTLVADSQPGQ